MEIEEFYWNKKGVKSLFLEIHNYGKEIFFFMRIYINGKFSAFQADDMGSIPIIR